MNEKGLTLGEVLAVSILVTALSILAYTGLSEAISRYRLRAAIDKLHSDIAKIKMNSLTSANLWGIRIERERSCYVIFEDRNRDCRIGSTSVGDNDCQYPGTHVFPDCNSPSTDCLRIVELPDGVTSSSDVSVVFDRKGYPRNALCGLGMFTIELKNPLDRRGRVIVDRYGRIRMELDIHP